MSSKKILKKLISCNTINDKENKDIINFIEQYLKEFGFKTDYKSNCLVMSNSDDCNIGFLGHTDTVSYSNDWNFSKNKKGIKLFFTYDEEIGFSGINELVDKKIEFPNNIIVGEPTNNEIINASKGLLELKITFKGISSHSSNPEEGINAIEKCIDFINKLKEYYNELREETIDSKYATMNVGVINGGRSMNIVPDNCEVQIDFRTVSKNQNKKIIKKVNEFINNNATCEIINNINPYSNNNEKINMSDYITEASFIESENKYILGVGPINAHKKDEFITIDSLNKLEEQYIEIIKEKCE